MKIENLSFLAPVVLRIALSGVFIWFGVSQILKPEMWMAIVPVWAIGFFGISAATIVLINGIFEIISGTLLVLGILVRPISALLFLHLFVIAFNFGFTPVGVRDFGLSFATLAVFLFGKDK